MISFRSTGNFTKTELFFERAKEVFHMGILDKYGKMGVEILKKNTPINSGKTAESWEYSIEKDSNGYSLVWHNTNINDGVPIAILIQYGHATGTGGYVKGTDYINPSMKPIFDDMANEIWKEVSR